MHKLAVLIYGALRSGKPFDVNFDAKKLAIQDGICPSAPILRSLFFDGVKVANDAGKWIHEYALGKSLLCGAEGQPSSRALRCGVRKQPVFQATVGTSLIRQNGIAFLFCRQDFSRRRNRDQNTHRIWGKQHS